MSSGSKARETNDRLFDRIAGQIVVAEDGEAWRLVVKAPREFWIVWRRARVVEHEDEVVVDAAADPARVFPANDRRHVFAVAEASGLLLVEPDPQHIPVAFGDRPGIRAGERHEAHQGPAYGIGCADLDVITPALRLADVQLLFGRGVVPLLRIILALPFAPVRRECCCLHGCADDQRYS